MWGSKSDRSVYPSELPGRKVLVTEKANLLQSLSARGMIKKQSLMFFLLLFLFSSKGLIF